MHLLWSLIVGTVLGAAARLLARGKDPGGIIPDALLGIVGALLAGALIRTPGIYRPGSSGPGIYAPVMGALVLLVSSHATRRRTASAKAGLGR